MSWPQIKKIIFPRIISTLLWNLIIHLLVLFLYNVISNLQLDIWTTIRYSVTRILSWWTICCTCFLTFILTTECLIVCRKYIAREIFQPTKLSLIVNNICFDTAFSLALHLSIGFWITFIFSSFLTNKEYGNLIVDCEQNTEKQCISEKRLCLLLGGSFVSCYYFVTNDLLAIKRFSFPIIKQKKFYQIKSNFINIFTYVMKYSIRPLIVYFLLYSFLKTDILNTVELLIDIFPNDSKQIKYLDIEKLWFLWIHLSLTILSIKSTESLLRIYLTQEHAFEIVKPILPSDNTLYMSEALSCKEVPLVQHLGYIDLVNLSQNNIDRRKDIFSLSQPAGKPHIWNKIKEECLDVINTFLQCTISLIKSAKSSKLTTSQYKCPETENSPASGNIFVEVGCHITTTCTEWLTQSRLWRFLFQGNINSNLEYLLSNNQIVIWSARSLSILACKSLKEDNFGIVQKDLPCIIEIMLKLRETLDTLPKDIYYKDSSQAENILKWKNEIRSSLQRDLYRIAFNFQNFISELQLNVVAQNQLLSYISCREV